MIISEITANGDWLNIVLDDSRKVSVNTDKTPKAKELKEGQDISQDWVIKEWNSPKDGVKLFLNEKKKGFAKRDYGMEKRIAALNGASRFAGISTDDVLKLADKYLKWLNG